MTRVRIARPGMTLVEVLVVVVILGLIAGTVAVGVSGALGKGKTEIARTRIGVISERLETYRLEHSAYPTTEQGLGALTTGSAKPTDTYFLRPDQLEDPWGRPFVLVVPGPDDFPYEVLTYGADGQRGGEGENADLSSTRLGETGGT
ncbi:MAG: type II secretion system major pseudopilin GspG [Planctomycetota bacterium]